jgi:hypothetical protein
MDPGKLDTVLAVIKSANIWDLITALHTEAAADPAVVEMICAKLSEHKSHELAFFLPQLWFVKRSSPRPFWLHGVVYGKVIDMLGPWSALKNRLNSLWVTFPLLPIGLNFPLSLRLGASFNFLSELVHGY